MKKRVNIICIVGDIDGIKDGDSMLLDKNIAELKSYKYFVVHNEAMRQWLKAFIQPATIATIDFFDFLATPFTGSRHKSRAIVFAGNLEKSVFLEDLHMVVEQSPEFHFNLYGSGHTKKMIEQNGVFYKGLFKAYDLPHLLEGSFGLVWDGISINEPGGSLGDYMRYISHHKISLYIISGLPLIVPSTAASAPLIKKYGIGIVVETLLEIPGMIADITDEQYEQMRTNMESLANKISLGQCMTAAIAELANLIDNAGKP